VLVVNVASACGLTAQNYTELVDIYEPLKAQKQLEVLAFPCDQFMHQEKGDTAAVCSFAARKGAKWPVFDKARACNAPSHAHPPCAHPCLRA
jgi:glutathione peroxidase